MSSTYAGQLRTQAQHDPSGNQLVTDAPLDNNGRGEAFSPTDLVATALGSCMMTMMGIVAQRENIDLAGTTWRTVKQMAASPRRIQQIDLEFNFPPLALSDEQRQKLERTARTCPVALSLHPDVVQQVTFHW
ncbi:OsmC family protein [Catalinimonas alkaloidigena]